MNKIIHSLLFLFLAISAYAQDTILYNDTFRLYSKGKMVNGKKEGHWISYDIVNSKTSDGYYKNGLEDGHWEFYLNKLLSSEGDYKRGKREGTWREYYIGGHEIIIGKYANGLKSGKWFCYDSDDFKLYQFSYGKLKRKTKLKIIGIYKNGVLVHNEKIE